MLNMFVMKKWAGLILSPLLPVMLFVIVLYMYGMLFAIPFMLVGLLLGAAIANMLLKNPFRDLVEGKGILCIDLNSTGVLRPFIVSVQSPFIRGRIGREPVNDFFDRQAVYNLATPVKAGKAVIKESGGISIDLDENEYNKGRMAMFHYPTLLYNSQIKSIITKDFISSEEKAVFAEHGILYLNRKMEELTSLVRDFGRHVVETLKPRSGILQNKWLWIIVVVFAIILLIMFLPSIIDTLGFTGETAVTAAQGVVANQPFTPTG